MSIHIFTIDKQIELKKFSSTLYKLFNYYCNGVEINTHNSRQEVTFNVKFLLPYNKVKDGKNTNFHVSNKHGMVKGIDYKKGYYLGDYGERHYDYEDEYDK